MNKLAKIAAAAAVAGAVGAGIGIYQSRQSGFTADEKATISLVQAFQSCMQTEHGPYTSEQTAKALVEAQNIINEKLAGIPANQRPDQETLDMVAIRLREQLLAQNACMDKTKLDVPATQAKIDAMINKYGEEKVKNAILGPQPPQR
jgi:hypothetical protein